MTKGPIYGYFVCTFFGSLPDGFRMIIEYKKSPIGYAQAYQLSRELFDEYDHPDDGHIVVAMDQLIGEPKYWSKGIGIFFENEGFSSERKLWQLNEFFLTRTRIIKGLLGAYEKAGFKIIKPLPKHELFEGEKVNCWLMELAL